MNAPLEVAAEVARLLRKAAEDRVTAQVAATDLMLADIACFHAQQAVEKMAKAALVQSGTGYPRSHDIGALAGCVPERFETLRILLTAASWLTLYATGSRYGESAEATSVESLAGLRAIEDVSAALDEAFGLRLPVLGERRPPTEPG